MFLLLNLFEVGWYQGHPWFKDIVWDRLYEMEAAFKPEVNGELDTQNFMKYDEVFHENELSLIFLLEEVSDFHNQ